jgi:hypothetical protein
VQQLIQECTGSSSADFSTARSYVRGCLKFHIRGAVKIPLCEDVDVLSWLMHSDDDINSQALQGCGASKVNDLALWLRDNGNFFLAGKLWIMLGQGEQAGSQYFRHALRALAKIPAGTEPEALSLEVEVRQRLFTFGDQQQEKAECLEWMVDLNGDAARMDQLDAQGKSMCHAVVGLALMGFSGSHYSTRTAAPVEQLQRGARSYLQYTLTGYSNWDEHTGFLKYYAYGQLCSPFTLLTTAYVASDVTNDRAIVSKVLGPEGEKLQAWHVEYLFSDLRLQWHLRVTINCSVNLI